MQSSKHLMENPEERNPDSPYRCEVCEDQVWIPMRRFHADQDVHILEKDFFSGQVHPSEAWKWSVTVNRECWCTHKQKEHKRIQKMTQQTGLSRRFQKRTFENFRTLNPNDFDADDREAVHNLAHSQKKAYERARQYVEKFKELQEEGKSFGLLGSYGTGKTHLLGSITNDLSARGVQAVFLNTTEFISQLKESFEKDEDGKPLTSTRASEYIEMVKNCTHLSLDDLGKEKPTGYVLEVLYRIINHRYENMLPINFTTNASLEELERQLGGAVYRRLVEPAAGYMLEVSGESYDQLLIRKRG